MRSNHVREVRVHAIMEDGETHTVIAHEPGPTGDNPRYIAQQFEAAMAELSPRLRHLAELYGDQIIDRQRLQIRLDDGAASDLMQALDGTGDVVVTVDLPAPGLPARISRVSKP
jgi:hypothetical protein